MRKNRQHPKVIQEYDLTDKSFFDSKEFASLCTLIVGLVRMAGKTGNEATYRFLREQIGDNRWLFEAVESCKRAGLICESGSAIRTVFLIGGVELKPEKSRDYSKGISVNPLPSQTNTLPDFYFEKANRL